MKSCRPACAIGSGKCLEGAYFTINRVRQFGKTTLLPALQRRLSGQCLVLRLSFEGVDD